MALPTLYETIGDAKLRELVDRFYNHVLEDPTIQHLFQTDIVLVKQKQHAFISQFLGGPPLYNQTFGTPRMRMRHQPHQITQAGKDAWLACMHKAIFELDLPPHIQEALYQCFPKLAQHMVNS